MDNIKMISERLNEEKWTRATLNSYTISNFKELDAIINDEYAKENASSLKEVCDEHLIHTKNSLIALYISGIISFMQQNIDDSKFISLIDLFKENHKWNIVEFLCNRILEYGENKYALRTLAECYENNNELEKKYQVWEKLIRIDYEEADIAKTLAELKRNGGDNETAISFYKKALYRYTNKKNYNQVKEIWGKLLEINSQEKEFFFQAEKKIALAFVTQQIIPLLDDFYKKVKSQDDIACAIKILKMILTLDPQDHQARREIVDCYRIQNANNPRIEEYINLTSLAQAPRNVHEAISDFEKHISFDQGNFVFHRTWGIGIITNVTSDELTIDFARQKNHKMKLKMAAEALLSLPKRHIWVLKSVWSKDKLKDKLKSDVLWGLKVLIQSFDNATSLKKIKAELVPSILSQNEWNSWSNEAKQILKNNPNFGNLPDKIDIYEVRTTPITLNEKIYNNFCAESNFYGKIKAIRDYVINGDPELDFFTDMYNYISTFTKDLLNVNDQVVSAWLFRKWSSKRLPHLPQSSKTFAQLIEKVSNIEELFNNIQDSELKQDFLVYLKEIKGWQSIYVDIFPSYLNKFIIDELVKFHHEDEVKNLFQNITERFKENKNSFLWMVKNIANLENYGIQKEQLIINLIHLLDLTVRDIDNKHDVSNNRKYNKNTETLLIKEKFLEDYLKDAPRESVDRIMELLSDIRGFNQSEFEELLKLVVKRFPDFKLEKSQGQSDREIITRGLIVCKSSYIAKERELKYIIDVEIPKNSKEIGAAIALGDLKENAEYKAGKEKQELLNITAGKLKEDLDKAHIFDFTTIDATKVGFGTVVTLKNNGENSTETITILGPWESNPENHIISYQSPYGKALLGAAVGDHLEFEINQRAYNLDVVSITKASEPSLLDEEEKVTVDFE